MSVPCKVLDPRNDTKQDAYLDTIPNVCPHCAHRIRPRLVSAVIVPSASPQDIEVLFQCVHESCFRAFLGLYETHTVPGHSHRFRIKTIEPVKPDIAVHPEHAAKVSPEFVKIYQQAYAAQQHGLDQVAGPGFRKAFEFLLKDFLLAEHPDKAESINSTLVGSLLSGSLVTDQNIKEVGARCAWLGNDEVHYKRKWEDKDVEDLKGLIHLLEYWIDSLIRTREMLKSMPKPTK